MFSFLKLIRIQNLLIIAFTQYMVRFCLILPLLKARSTYYQLQLTEVQFFLLVLSTVMIAAAGYIINDYFDIKIDKVNKPDQVVIDKGIKRRVAMGAHTVINFIGIIIGLYVSYSIGYWKLAILQFICATGLWFYSTNFKRMFLIGNFVIALFTALVPLVVGIYELLLVYKHYFLIDDSINLTNIWRWVFGLSFFAFITTLLREIIKDMEDYEGDKEYGCYTMPIAIGIKSSKWIVVFLSAATMTCLAYLQYMQYRLNDYLSVGYFVLFLQLPFCFLIYKTLGAMERKQFRLAGNTAKFIMFMGVSYLFVVYYLMQ
jgi:4-hydroxybenzoate polyprenyltransferase